MPGPFPHPYVRDESLLAEPKCANSTFCKAAPNDQLHDTSPKDGLPFDAAYTYGDLPLEKRMICEAIAIGIGGGTMNDSRINLAGRPGYGSWETSHAMRSSYRQNAMSVLCALEQAGFDVVPDTSVVIRWPHDPRFKTAPTAAD